MSIHFQVAQLDAKYLLHNLDSCQSHLDDLCQDSGLTLRSVQQRADCLQSEIQSYLDSWKLADEKSKRVTDLLYDWNVLVTNLEQGVPALQESIESSTFDTFDQAKVI